jgi:hypothetical protein
LIEWKKEMSGPGKLQAGDMWFHDERWRDESGYYVWPFMFSKAPRLSDFYKQNNAGREPLLVWLPGGTVFCVDAMCWEGARLYGGWQVTGEPPLITVSPSINIKGLYHGWIQNGVILDDCEGRTYADN